MKAKVNTWWPLCDISAIGNPSKVSAGIGYNPLLQPSKGLSVIANGWLDYGKHTTMLMSSDVLLCVCVTAGLGSGSASWLSHPSLSFSLGWRGDVFEHIMNSVMCCWDLGPVQINNLDEVSFTPGQHHNLVRTR